MPVVLLIDDDPDQLLIYGQFLQKHGCEVVTARGAAEGFRALEEQAIDIIVCDIMMPEVCGHDLLAEVKSNPRHSELPIIMLTAADYFEDFSIKKGADSFCRKSSSARELLRQIEKLLSLKNGEGETA